MKLEQPRALNRFVDDSIPLTWRVRWRMLRLFLPFFCVLGLFSAEGIALQFWLEGVPAREVVLRCVFGFAFPFLAVFLCAEVSIRRSHRARRILQTDEGGVLMRHNQARRVAWRDVCAFQIDPVFGHSDLARVSIVYAASRKSEVTKTWSIALNRAVQLPQLLYELRFQHQLRNSFEVSEFSELPPPKAYRPMRLRALWLDAVAMFFILHGLVFLAVGFKDRDDAAEPRSPPPNEVAEARREQLGLFLFRHFKSADELQTFFRTAGILLTGLAVVCFAAGARILKRDVRLARKEQQVDLDSNKRTAVVVMAAKT